ncbi:relaxase domain-containing protein [Streptomyces sp. ISL-44]|uniref:relaxase domain-containing protein n=1 Tax=Streptomyces sp. ISL-44 TaxID=2819184 RepID=UPI0027E2AE99|nr:relaxase domain-containing protein [Streptomyces sp. ISL-44]
MRGLASVPALVGGQAERHRGGPRARQQRIRHRTNQSPETEKTKERKPWLAMDLVFRAPSTAHIAWALGDYETRLVLELCQDIARDKTLAWLEDAVAQIRWKSGGKQRKPIRDGLMVAVFRHYESRAAESKPSCTTMRWCRSAPGGRTRQGRGATCRRTRC